uniref:Centrosomal protein 57kDa-like protein 1 n=1 Tax=Neogobius melanostomus TaxID=47308 RepID=A0A8C6UFN3_9GOBI
MSSIMEACNEQGLDSPSRNSYIGSYYQPPDIMIPLPRRLDFPFHSVVDSEQPTTSHRVTQPKSNIDSKAVVDALKTLQGKINRVEAETSRHTEKSLQMSQESQTNLQTTVLPTLPTTRHQQPTKEHEAIIKCKTLRKHLEKTKRCIERAKKEQSTLQEKQTLLQKEQFNTSIQLQNTKLEKLESKYDKLRRTQTLSEMKLAMLEEKLQKEEHERKLVQEKAEEKTSRQSEQKSPSGSFSQMPFVAGTSTSPSHSVHANVQSILHMMKHHQPQLHERVSLLQKSVRGARKSLRKDFSTSNAVQQRRNSESRESEASLGSLYDLLLALQDELGQMSFEQQELMHQIDSTFDHKKRQDLKNELEQLVSKWRRKELRSPSSANTNR